MSSLRNCSASFGTCSFELSCCCGTAIKELCTCNNLASYARLTTFIFRRDAKSLIVYTKQLAASLMLSVNVSLYGIKCCDLVCVTASHSVPSSASSSSNTGNDSKWLSEFDTHDAHAEPSEIPLEVTQEQDYLRAT